MSTHGTVRKYNWRTGPVHLSTGSTRLAQPTRPQADFDDSVRRTKLQLQLLTTVQRATSAMWRELFGTFKLTTGQTVDIYDSTANLLMLHNDASYREIGFGGFMTLTSRFDPLGTLRMPLPGSGVASKMRTGRLHLAVFDIDPFSTHTPAGANNTPITEQQTADAALAQEVMKVNKFVNIVMLVENIPVSVLHTDSVDIEIPLNPSLNVPRLIRDGNVLAIPGGEPVPTMRKHLDFAELAIPSTAAPERLFATKRLVGVFYEATGDPLQELPQALRSVYDDTTKAFTPLMPTTDFTVHAMVNMNVNVLRGIN